MISINIGLLMILVAVAVVVIGIVLYVVKGMGKRGARVSRERTSGNPVNANNNLQSADDDITREDAETFLAIVELLDQLY